MTETTEADRGKKGDEYSGSPVPFAFFMVLFLVFLFLTILSFPRPESLLFAVAAFVSLAILPTTVAINKEWEEAIIVRFGKF